MNENKSGHEGKKHKQGVRPVVINSQLSKWLNESTRDGRVNTFSKGGGKPQK